MKRWKFSICVIVLLLLTSPQGGLKAQSYADLGERINVKSGIGCDVDDLSGTLYEFDICLDKKKIGDYTTVRFEEGNITIRNFFRHENLRADRIRDTDGVGPDEGRTGFDFYVLNPKLDIVARVHRDADSEFLKGIGVTELVLPFFEGSLEMIRHTLHRFGMSSTEIQYILNTLREGQSGKPPEE